MTAARAEKAYADVISAREFLAQAETFLSDAQNGDNSAESRALLAHQAAVSACDSLLTARGVRITQGDGAHQLRLTATAEQLDDVDDLFDRLDDSRARRNEASYHAQMVPTASLEDALEATAELIETVRAHVA